MSAALRLLSPAVLLFVTAGCGSGLKTYPVSGRVAFPDGQPLPTGWVELRSTDAATKDRTARGQIQPDGKFTIEKGAVKGEHQAIITTPMDPRDGDDERKMPKLWIDRRFQDFARSGLTITVKAEPNENVVLSVHKPK